MSTNPNTPSPNQRRSSQWTGRHKSHGKPGQKIFIPSDSENLDYQGDSNEDPSSSRTAVITYRELPPITPGGPPVIKGHLYTPGPNQPSIPRTDSNLSRTRAGRDGNFGHRHAHLNLGQPIGSSSNEELSEREIADFVSLLMRRDVINQPHEDENTFDEISNIWDFWDDDDDDDATIDGSALIRRVHISWLEEEIEDRDDLRNLGDLLARPLCRTDLAELVDKCGWKAPKLKSLDSLLKPFTWSDRKDHLDILLLAEKTRLNVVDDDPFSMALFIGDSDIESVFNRLERELTTIYAWCPSTVHFLRSAIGVDGLHYAKLQFKQPYGAPKPPESWAGTVYESEYQSYLRHTTAKCTTTNCHALTVDTHNYEQTHMGWCRSDSICFQLSVDIERVVEIIRKGGIPRVRIPHLSTGMDKSSLLQVDDHSPYIAISHVWAHGLGNSSGGLESTRNSVPFCRLFSLQSRVRQLQELPRSGRCPDFSVWLDTLCIPATKEYADVRKVAINTIPRTFSDAEHVLVLDRDVQRTHEDATKTEIAVAILRSDWTRRLWTLQEAMLADNPYQYQGLTFALQARNFNIEQFATFHHLPPYGEKAMRFLLEAFTLLNTTPWPTTPKGDLIPEFLNVLKGLEYRNLTRLLDEYVCVGAILGMGQNQLADLVESDSPDERMRQILKYLHYVPSSIIFCDGERILNEPFHWAPRTFLTVENLSRYQVIANGGPGVAEVTDEGFNTCFPGIKLLGPEQYVPTEPFLLKISAFEMYGPVIDWDKICDCLCTAPELATASDSNGDDDLDVQRDGEDTHATPKAPLELIAAFEKEATGVQEELPDLTPEEWLAEAFQRLIRQQQKAGIKHESEASPGLEHTMKDDLAAAGYRFAQSVGYPFKYESSDAQQAIYQITAASWEIGFSKKKPQPKVTKEKDLPSKLDSASEKGETVELKGWDYYSHRLFSAKPISDHNGKSKGSDEIAPEHDTSSTVLLFNPYLRGQGILLAVTNDSTKDDATRLDKVESDRGQSGAIRAKFLCQVSIVEWTAGRSKQLDSAVKDNAVENLIPWESLQNHEARNMWKGRVWCIT